MTDKYAPTTHACWIEVFKLNKSGKNIRHTRHDETIPHELSLLKYRCAISPSTSSFCCENEKKSQSFFYRIVVFQLKFQFSLANHQGDFFYEKKEWLSRFSQLNFIHDTVSAIPVHKEVSLSLFLTEDVCFYWCWITFRFSVYQKSINKTHKCTQLHIYWWDVDALMFFQSKFFSNWWWDIKGSWGRMQKKNTFAYISSIGP